MPTRTFLNLKKEKKDRIEKALIHEFSKSTFEQASITNIIKEANIPRGSFYQYFEDKKDAVKYIIEKFILMDYEKMSTYLKETDGNIFKTALKIYDYRTEENILNFNIGIAKNILGELRKNNINVFENMEILKNEKSLIEFINKDILDLEDENDIYYFIKIITSITRSVTTDVFTGKISKEEGRKILQKELKIVENGMKK